MGDFKILAHSNDAVAQAKVQDVNVIPSLDLNVIASDSVAPFLEYRDKYIFILCLTSNPGASDFQLYGAPALYLRVAEFVHKWDKKNNCGLVVGATKPEQLGEIRKIVPKAIFLVPGIGAQGGKVEEVLKYGGDNLIINASRSIIYASSGADFAQKAQEETIKLRDEINRWRKKE